MTKYYKKKKNLKTINIIKKNYNLIVSIKKKNTKKNKNF